MTHEEMVTRAGELCDRFGVRWCYFPDSRKIQGHKGFPDLVMCGSHRLMIREIKAGSDDMKPEQTSWRYQLKAAGIDHDVWRQPDFTSRRAEEEIRALNES